MSDEINLTLIEDDEEILVSVTEENPITVEILEVATVDPGVAQALLDAQAAQVAAEAALTAAQTAEAAAIAAAQEAADTVASIETVVDDALTEALAGLGTDSVPEGDVNFYYTEARFDSSLAGKSTDDVSEGDTNLYYTNARFDTRLAAKTTDNITEGPTNKYYSSSLFNASFSAKSTTDLLEGANLYYTQARFDSAFGLKTTANLAELTNLYFTTSRARTAAVVNSTAGSETDQAASVAAMKTYVLANVTAPVDGSVTKAKLATGAKDLTLAAKTSAYSITASDELITCDASSAAFTVTLPTAVGVSGRVYTIKKTDSSFNQVTIATTSSQTIDGVTTRKVSTQNESVVLASDGANWQLLSRRIPSGTVTYTPTFNSGFTVGTGGSALNKFSWYRDKEYLVIHGGIMLGTTSFSMGTGQFTATVPSGLTIDTSKLSMFDGYPIVGISRIGDFSASAERVASVLINNSSTTTFFFGNGTLFNGITSTVPWTWAASDFIEIKEIRVPISGWEG